MDGLQMQKSEAIDWRNHPTLNGVTKYAISQFEKQYLLSDFMEEMAQKEAKTDKNKQKKPVAQDLDSDAQAESERSGDEFDFEEEEDEH